MKIIDTHTHLNVSPLYEQVDDIVAKAKEMGVEKVINNGDTFESFNNIRDLAERYPNFCYSAIGIFPTTEYESVEVVINRLEEEIKKAKNLVAIGEIGLDYSRDNSMETRKKQKELFLAQIRLAEKYNLPIIVHSRDAEADTFNTIIDSGFKGNVTLHCFSASFQMALRYLRHKKNVYFGVGGIVTFKNARKLVETVERVPTSQLIVETDAPYLTPVPHRGKMNQPCYLPYVINKMAEILHADPELLAEGIYQTSKKVYDL